MARTPQVSNEATRRALGTTPLGVTGMPPALADADTLPSDVSADVIRIGGMRLEISNSGRLITRG